jgi:hypothetical protein
MTRSPICQGPLAVMPSGDIGQDGYRGVDTVRCYPAEAPLSRTNRRINGSCAWA